MPTLFLKVRAQLSEAMDDPHCDHARLMATYHQFGTLNLLLANWRQLYVRYIRSRQPSTLLDIGCGGGDVLRRVAGWARQDGLKLHCTGIDLDERALEFASAAANPALVTFEQAHASELLTRGRRFDVVISNHLLHHLTDTEVARLCEVSASLARQQVIHNDIRRSDLAFVGFQLSRLLFHRSFIVEDGLVSIRRSFTPRELLALLPPGWQLRRQFPYRNILLYDAEAR
jgi:2-polyprenyl-3-methyl-5-hydroxy-6-metoxy-1,4-benzoquinol methylase